MPRLSTNQAALERRGRIIQRIAGGASPKEIAYDEGMAATTVYRIAWEEGFYRQWVRDSEWKQILKLRKESKS